MGNLLTTHGEEVGNMMISCPGFAFILSVLQKETSTQNGVVLTCLRIKMEYQSVFQAETQAKILSIELPPSSVRRRITLNYCTVIGKNFATPQTRTIVKILMWQLFQ